jgi:hypothetical protein
MNDDGTGFEIVTVRKKPDGSHDLGKSIDSEPPSIRDVGDYGWGELRTEAFDRVRDRLDPEEFDRHTELAKVHYDLDRWAYSIEWLVEIEPATGFESLVATLREVIDR